MCSHCSARRCIVVEDSLIGLQAARDAGMKCVITHTPSTASQDFTGAVAIYPELGDAGSEQVTAQDLLDMLSASYKGGSIAAAVLPAPVV